MPTVARAGCCLALAALCAVGEAGRVECSVARLGEPVLRATVELFPGGHRRFTVADGTCVFAGVREGEYRVVASKEIDGIYYAASRENVSVPAAGTVTLSFALTRAIMINEYLPRPVGMHWDYEEVTRRGGDTVTRAYYERTDRRITRAGVSVVELKGTWDTDPRRHYSYQRSSADGFAVYAEKLAAPGSLTDTAYDPPLLIPNPVPVGHRFTLATTATASGDVLGAPSGEVVWQVTLEGFEDVTVPAGTFAQCARIRLTVRHSSQTTNYRWWLGKNVGLVKMTRTGSGVTTVRRLTRWMAPLSPANDRSGEPLIRADDRYRLPGPVFERYRRRE